MVPNRTQAGHGGGRHECVWSIGPDSHAHSQSQSIMFASLPLKMVLLVLCLVLNGLSYQRLASGLCSFVRLGSLGATWRNGPPPGLSRRRSSPRTPIWPSHSVSFPASRDQPGTELFVNINKDTPDPAVNSASITSQPGS